MFSVFDSFSEEDLSSCYHRESHRMKRVLFSVLSPFEFLVKCLVSFL